MNEELHNFKHPFPKLIGLTGKAGVGKDTFAMHLLELGLVDGVVSFATPMRSMLRGLGVPHCYMTDRNLKESVIPGFGVSYRHLAQTLGTEWGRKCIAEDFWLRRAGELITKELRLGGVVVTDVRFDNEAKWVRDAGGVVVKIVRGVPGVREHASEKGVSEILVDFTIHNTDDSPQAFCERALASLKAYMEEAA